MMVYLVYGTHNKLIIPNSVFSANDIYMRFCFDA